MYEYLTNHIPEAIGIGSSAASAGGFFLVRWILRRRRRNKMLRKFDANDMRELAIEARNKKLRKDLSDAYRFIKKAIYHASTGNAGCKLTVCIWKWCKYYFNQYDAATCKELFVDRLISRLMDEGFSAEYLPGGETGVKTLEPSLKVMWGESSDDLERMVEEELEKPGETGKEGATW